MRTLIAAGIGLLSGVASGAFGVGGGALSTPGIRVLLGTPALVAVGTTLPVIVPTALAGLWAYVRGGFVDRGLALRTAAAGVPLSVLGASVTAFVPGEVLLVATAAVILVLSLRMLPRPRTGQAPAFNRSLPALVVVGASSGFLSGLLGIGGGIVLVPAFSVLLRMPVKTAVGTSLVVVAAQSIPGTAVHAALGNIDWAIAAGLVLGTVPGARLGSRLAVLTQERHLRMVVGLGIAALAVAFGAGELRQLLR